MLPFSVEEFFTVFADYNRGVWPMQWVLISAAVAILGLAAIRTDRAERVVCMLLGGLWAWMALAYHFLYFSGINPAAIGFAVVFGVEALLFLRCAGRRRPLGLRLGLDARSLTGIALVFYALVVYPLLGRLLGHAYPATPTFGVPCPTTIFTMGILIMARARRSGVLLLVPIVWSAVGGSAAFLLGIWQDLGLLVGGLVAAGWLAIRRLRAGT